MTFLFGVRYDRQRGYYEAGRRAPILSDIFPTRETPGRSFKAKHNVAPRLGVNYALQDGKTVVKAFWGRFYNELATVLANNANPGGENYRIYQFRDTNGNRLFDGSGELGDVVSATGGISTTIDENFRPPYADEFSSAVEHQFWGESSLRVAYVRKMARDIAGIRNVLRDGQFTVPTTVNVNLQEFGLGSTGAEAITIYDIPAALRGQVQNVYTNWPDADYNYDTIQLGFNKRWAGGFFVQSSFDYQWRNELRGAPSNGNATSQVSVSGDPLSTDPIGVGFFHNVRPDVPNRQKTRNWQAHVAGRYVFKYDIGIGVNYRVQSGYGYARVITTALPNAGTVSFFASDLRNNYSDTVPILDFRVDKALAFGRFKASLMLDLFNSLNVNPVSNFVLTNGTAYNRIIAALDPRTAQIGVRFQF